MPHTPATHLTITPNHVYINGEPISVASGSIEVSAPTTTDIQTVELTIYPTTVTILNDDGTATRLFTKPETSTHEWLQTTQDEPDNKGREDYFVNCTREALDNWKRHEATYAKRTRTTH